MRSVVLDYLTKQAEIDPTIYLVVGDVGFSVVERFQEKFPQRFINAGIAEQNMIGLAAGLAMAGNKVYVYSIIPFVTMRCFEQVRNNLCYQNLPVRLIGVGGGFSYGPLGVTHHSVEDIAIMRCLPEMTVVAPSSKHETEHLIPQIDKLAGPAYLRLSKNKKEEFVYPDKPIKLGKAIELVPHEHRFVVATANTLELATNVFTMLKDLGIDIGLVSMPTVKPLDSEFFTSKTLSAVFTIEEHSVIGGLGEGVARLISEKIYHKVIFKAFGINDFYPHVIGSRSYLMEQAGLHEKIIAQKIKDELAIKTTQKAAETSHMHQAS
jgi:transketolase